MSGPNWDIDLAYGKAGEGLVAEILADQGHKVEVKNDRQWVNTGNIYVEAECRGKPSGIQTTEATWWVFVVSDACILILSTEALRSAVYNELGRPAQEKDGSHPTRGRLIPTRNLLAWIQTRIPERGAVAS